MRKATVTIPERGLVISFLLLLIAPNAVVIRKVVFVFFFLWSCVRMMKGSQSVSECLLLRERDLITLVF